MQASEAAAAVQATATPMPSKAAAAVLPRRVANSQSVFRGTAIDGLSRPGALERRIDLATRQATGNSRNHRPQSEADRAAALLDSFHTVLDPYLTQRCSINDRTGRHVRSIRDKDRFVTDNIKYRARTLG